MKAIILSAGQGRRLLPYTESRPKCLVPVEGRPIVEWQLRCLRERGVSEAVIVTGFQTQAVEAFTAQLDLPGLTVRTLFNPFFAVADNLASLYMARDELRDGGIILNGDTLFEPAVLERLLQEASAPVTVTIDRKSFYDDDDMKVRLDGNRLAEIGKTLPAANVDGESIGMIHLDSIGAAALNATVREVLRQPDGLRRWYLSAVDLLAQRQPGIVEAVSIEGFRWGEIDCPSDLQRAEALTRDLRRILFAVNEASAGITAA